MAEDARVPARLCGWEFRTALDPACVEALKVWLEKSAWAPVELAA